MATLQLGRELSEQEVEDIVAFLKALSNKASNQFVSG